jgi:iron-sulfur cluster repair protein YtfE (RIC family)
MPKTDILSLLEKDHKEAKALLQEIIDQCDSEEDVDFSKVEEIRDALELHTKIEEKYLYPNAEEVEAAAELVTESYKEHDEIKELLKELKDDLEPSEIGKYCKQILIGVEHHVEEEEDELFPILRKSWEQQRLQELGEKAMEMKEKAMSR